MLYPSIDKLMEKVDSRYTLVIMASKRARQILEGDRPVVDTNSKKAVSIAVSEIAAGKVSYKSKEEADIEREKMAALMEAEREQEDIEVEEV